MNQYKCGVPETASDRASHREHGQALGLVSCPVIGGEGSSQADIADTHDEEAQPEQSKDVVHVEPCILSSGQKHRHTTDIGIKSKLTY